MSLSARFRNRSKSSWCTHRRGFLKSAGLLAVSFGAFAAVAPATCADAAAPQGPGPYPDPDFHQIDSWIVIHENNTATFYVGKTDPGQGTGTGFRQLMSDELDIAFDKTTCIMGSTDITVDQVGSGGSTAMERDSWPMRRVAAEARRVLLEMASTRLGVPVDQLAVSDAVITVKGRSLEARYLWRTDRRKEVQRHADRRQHQRGHRPGKDEDGARSSNTPASRCSATTFPAKVDGSLKWAVDVKLPGMVHARNVKPPFACAKLTGIDESSVKNLPGFIKVVSKGNYVAVVCEREEQAIRAARAAQDDVGEAGNRSVPRVGRSLQLHARGATAAVDLPGDRTRSPTATVRGQSRCGIRGRGKDDRSRVRDSVPGTYGVRRRACHGGPVERSDDGLFERHEVLRHAERRRHVSRHAAGQGARGLDAGPAGLRPHGGGGRGLRGGLDRARNRPARPHAVDER